MANGQGCAGLYPLSWRGGTGLMYNNSSTGYYVPFGIEIFRVAYPNCQTSGATTMCEDWWPHCGPNSSTPGAICYFTPANPNNGVVDCSDHSCDYTGCTAGFGGCKDAEGKSMYCIQIDGGGSGNYPCRDQQGRGKETLPAGTEALQPLYYWNNYFNGSPTSLSGTLGYSSDYIQQNREYCNQSPNDPTGSCSKASWSYTPAPCPDPRAGVSGTCAADQYGRDGYPTASSDVTPPAAPSGLVVE